MSKRPSFAIKVNDLATSIKFLVQDLGFELVDYRPHSDIAYILDLDKDLTLLAGSTVENISELLDPPRFVFKPGDTISFLENDVEGRQAALLAKGITNAHIEPGFLGDQKLSVAGPDSYTFVFIKVAQHLSADVLVVYEKGLSELDDALAGLSETDLDLTRTPGQWSIRYIVHHLAESESLFLMQLKTALAQSGTTYIRNSYNQEIWPDMLNYAARPIEPSLAFVKASRQHILQLLHYVPNYRERYVLVEAIDSEGHAGEERKTTVGNLLEIMARHLQEHTSEIHQIRQSHQ